MECPTVSIIMAALNEEKYLPHTIESILNQTFADYEFIIVNDGSTDSTQQILDRYAQKDKRIKTIVNEKNIGLTRSLNRGLEQAKGKYISRIDAGDIALTSRLEKQVRFLENNGGVYILGTFGRWINEDKEVVGDCNYPTTPVDIKRKLFGLTSISAHSSLMLRKELFERTGQYDSRCSTSMEYELYMRAIKNHFGIGNLPENLTHIMWRERGISLNKMRAQSINEFKIRLRYLPSFLNFRNIIYTMLSFLLILLPSSWHLKFFRFYVRRRRRK